jgi:hypothetical protein
VCVLGERGEGAEIVCGFAESMWEKTNMKMDHARQKESAKKETWKYKKTNMKMDWNKKVGSETKA